MIGPPKLNRRNAQIIRSQFALEVMLSVLALAGGFLILRLVFKLLSIPARVWSGGLVYSVTDRLVWPLTLLPGSSRPVLADATLGEFTAVAIVMMLPLAIAARGRARPA